MYVPLTHRHGREGYSLRVCRLCRLSLSSVLLFLTSMTANINNFGVINFYENNAAKQEPKQKNEHVCEDITPLREEPKHKDLPFLVASKLQELNLYSLQEFEGMYRKAVRGDAKNLASFLKKYRDLQVLDFKGYNKKQIFEELKAYFGDELDFGYPNFAAYY